MDRFITREELETLSESSNVSLVWVPGHYIVVGNEEADRCVKYGQRVGADRTRVDNGHRFNGSTTEA